MEYSLNGVTWVETVPEGTQPGTYYVLYRVTGDANHKDVAPASVASTIIKNLEYKVVKGNGATWTKTTDGELSFTAKRYADGEKGDTTFEHFEGVTIDGAEVPAESSSITNWTKQSGSVIVTFSPEYLGTLAVGEHTLSMTFDDWSGNCTATFSVVKFPKQGVKGEQTVTVGKTVALDDYVRTLLPIDDTEAIAYSMSQEGDLCTVENGVLTAGNVPGNAVVTASVAENDDHKEKRATIDVTIVAKATQVIEAEDVAIAYGDTDKGITVANAESLHGAITFAVKDGSEGYVSVNESTGQLKAKAVPESGEAYVTVTAAGDADYAEATKDVKVSISKASIAPVVAIEGWTYGDSPNEPSLGQGSNPGNGAVVYEYKAAGASDATYVPFVSALGSVPTTAGDYVMRATVAETDNYYGGNTE